jgi:hypothetical protein
VLERFTSGPAHVGNVRVADRYEVDVPVALRLDFAAGPVLIVVGIPQWPEMQEVFVPGDQIMVVFSTDRMRHERTFPRKRVRLSFGIEETAGGMCARSPD